MNRPYGAVSGPSRAALAKDPAVGAGNWLHAAMRQDRDTEAPVLYLDSQWRTPLGSTSSAFSLTELHENALALAARYHAVGVRPRDPVGVYTAHAVEYVLHYVALTSIGAVPVLVNRALDPAIALTFFHRAGAIAIFCDEQALARFDGAPGDWFSFLWTHDDIVGSVGHHDLPADYPYRHDDTDPVLITHSSGTTGFPKGVPMQHGNFFSAMRYRMRLALPDSAARVLCALPASHNSAITQLTFNVLAGLPILMLSSQSADSVLDSIERFKPTMVSGFSTTFAAMSERDLDGRDLESVRLWWNSGDAAHERHIRTLQAYGSHYEIVDGRRTLVPGSAFTDALGSSEMGHSLFNNLHKPGAPFEPRCVGKPLDFVDAVVLDDQGQQLGADEVGMLGIKSPTLTTGYWNNSTLTARSRLAGYWLTGDLVRRDDAGRFFHLDRISDVIRTAEGPLYSLQAEELIIRTFEEVADCTLIGVPSSTGSHQDAHAFLQASHRVRPATFDGQGWLVQINELLARHALPSVRHAVRKDASSLPVGPTGKVRKADLRAMIQDQYVSVARMAATAIDDQT